jgi:hypothetical protein
MYTTAKGYVVPVVLVVVLLVTAGYFVFTGTPAEAPEAVTQVDTTVRATTTSRTPVVRDNEPDSATSTDGADDADAVATGTASTTIDLTAELE